MSSSLRATGWLIGAVVCLLVANRLFSCLLTWAMDGRIVLCGTVSLAHANQLPKSEFCPTHAGIKKVYPLKVIFTAVGSSSVKTVADRLAAYGNKNC